MPFSVYKTLPVDINGDGRHELVRSGEDNCELLDSGGKVLSRFGGSAEMVGKLFGLPGEQIVCSNPDGKVQIWRDINAQDNADAKFRYNHPFYRANRKLTATGSNRINLGGL